MNADVDLILVGVDSNGTSEVAAILTLVSSCFTLFWGAVACLLVRSIFFLISNY